MNKWNVIVVGAGNAGLTAAATALSKGKKVLLLERNAVPGGSATSFCRGRFEFESALHEMASVGTQEKPGSVRRMFESFGIPIDWHTEKNLYRVIADGEDGFDVTMPVGTEAFCDAIEEAVPGCRESVEAFFKCVKKIDAGIGYLSSGAVDPKVLLTEHGDFLRMASHSIDECMNALEIPKKAQDILKVYWTYLGTPTDEMDMVHFGAMMIRYVEGSPAIPGQKSHELSLGLESAIRKMGGEIRYHAEVEEILIEDGRAVGVRVGEEKLYADAIICNCFPDTVYKSYLPKEAVPDRAKQLANARVYGMPFFTVYLGLNRTKEELGIKDYSVFLFDSPDSKEQFDSCSSTDHMMVIGNCLNCVIPDATPAGTSSLFLTTMLTEEVFRNVTPETYYRLKNEIADRMIRKYEEKLHLNLREHIEEIVIAAPPTFARYLNTPNGTPYGYRITPYDRMLTRIMSASKEQFIKGLAFVGAHGERGDGYSSAYANGNAVAKQVCREESK